EAGNERIREWHKTHWTGNPDHPPAPGAPDYDPKDPGPCALQRDPNCQH
ncbi:hypothetical protein MY1884_009725, partial [Beauveria asiatica]